MKKLMLLIITMLLIFGCATTTPKRVIENKTKKNDTVYNTYPINISLIENQRLLKKLNDKLITFVEYDSLLTKSGRTPSQSLFIENCICNTNNNQSFEDAVRAEYFFGADSLVDIIKIRMENLTKTDSTYTMPYIYLGIISCYNNESEMALKHLNKAQKFSSNFENSDLNIFKAEIYKESKDYYKATNEYEIAFKKNEELINYYWESLFTLYIYSTQYDKAESLFKRIEISSQDADFRKNHLEKLLTLSWEKGDFEETKKICESLRDSTNSIYIDKELVNISIMQNRLSEAKKHLLYLCSIDLNSFPNPVFDFPKFDSLDTHYSESLKKLKQIINISPDNSNANFCYGFLLVSKELNKYSKDRNEEMIREGLAFIKKSDSSDSEVQYIIGYINQKLENIDEALECFSKVNKKSKYYPYSLINRAILLKKENLNTSLSYLIDAQKIMNNEPKLIEKIGDYYYLDFNDYKNSIIWYKKLLTLEPNNHLRSIWLANSYLQLDDIENAQLTISQTIDRIFTDESSWFKNRYLGMAYETKGDINQKLEKWEQAKRDYENSIKYNPDNMEPRLSLAKVYYQLNNVELAEETYLTVIDSIINKDNIQYYKLDYYYALEGLNWHYLIYDPNPIKRAEIFEQAIKHFPSDDWCYRVLGIAYTDQERYYKAKENLNKSIELNPNNHYTYSNFAYVYEKENNFSDAIVNYNKAIKVIEKENLQLNYKEELEKYEDNLISIGEYHSKIANLYTKKKDYDLAIIEYKRAISITPDTTEILYKFKLASAYFNNKDFIKAIENWDIVFNKNRDYNAKCNIALSYFNIGGIDNLKKSKKHFSELQNLIIDESEYIELSSEVKNRINIIDTKISRIEWPDKINELAKSNISLISEIAIIYKLTDSYRDINNLWIEGIKETTPVKEGNIITSYNVSSKIFQSESLCDRFKSKISLIETQNSKLKEIKNLWILASETRKEGIKLHSQGYYVKAVNYAGEYERGRAKIYVANQYYADGLKILRSLMQQNINFFSKYGVETLDDMIKYYESKE